MILRVDLSALLKNYESLNALSLGRAGCVVKCDAYGLGIETVVPALWNIGARVFFVATPFEAITLNKLLPEATIYDLSGLSGSLDRPENIISVVNSLDQYKKRRGHYALQFDTGMTRLGLDEIIPMDLNDPPRLILSHLACSDEPGHPQNRVQLERFQVITAHYPNIPASLAATGGILLGKYYHFDLTRPGIGLYGGAPFADAKPVAQIELPVLNIRNISPKTTVGYGAEFTAKRTMPVAVVLGGYGDGLLRALKGGSLFHEGVPCRILGRISMDSITVDISNLDVIPERLCVFDTTQTLDDLAKIGGTVGYELLTSLGKRYKRIIHFG